WIAGLIGLLIASSLPAMAQSPSSQKLEQMMLEDARAQMAAASADEAMIKKAGTVADLVVKFYESNNRFPESWQELAKSTGTQVHKTGNPYLIEEILGQQVAVAQSAGATTGNGTAPAAKPVPDIQIQPDAGISSASCTHYADFPPLTWRAPAGTITILHNTEK